MEANIETLISLLATKELELKEMRLYIKQLESTYNALATKYNDLVHLHYSKKKRIIGFKPNK